MIFYVTHKQPEESVFDNVGCVADVSFSLAPCLSAMVALSEQKV